MNKIPKFGKILIVDDDEDVLFAARLFLKRHFALVQTVDKIVLVNGLHAGPGRVLKEGDLVFVLPEVDGG